jgi:hypothetical protein
MSGQIHASTALPPGIESLVPIKYYKSTSATVASMLAHIRSKNPSSTSLERCLYAYLPSVSSDVRV